MILSLRTDSPTAELYLHSTDGKDKDSYSWEAGRQLSLELIPKIEELLKRNNLSKTDISQLGVFRGPGSFTGLRIGLTVANALAEALDIPIVGALGDDWLKTASKQVAGSFVAPVLPEYGRPARITKPRK